MPTVIKLSQIEEEQASDPELVYLLKGTTSLNLQRVQFDDSISLYRDVSTGSVRPYVPKSLRNAVFVRSRLVSSQWSVNSSSSAPKVCMALDE